MCVVIYFHNSININNFPLLETNYVIIIPGDNMRLDVKRLNRILGNLYSEFRLLEDSDRELPMKWSTMHMYTSSQLAVLVALKKDLNPELLGIIAALHDIGAVRTKKRENHAINGEPFVKEIIKSYNTLWRGNLDILTDAEQQIIIEAVINHSDKDNISDNPYVEAMKDVDSLDRYLHGVPTKGAHVTHLNYMLELFDIDIKKDT